MKKKLFRILLFLIGLFILAIAFCSLSFKQKVNANPLPSFYKKGVYHLHSTFSDGRGDIGSIGHAAVEQNLDFVILTDHGRPNLRSSAATAWSHNTLIIGASEFSVNEGHLAAAGYRVPAYIFPPEAQEAITEVDRDQGVTFIAHPLDRRIPWTNWRVHGFTGIEIVSLYQLAKKNMLRGLVFLPPQYLFNPDYALTCLISYPESELAIWDRCNRSGKYYAIYALDSHAKLPITKKASLHFPSYGATFRILTIYVKVERELSSDAHAAAAAIIAAIRCGDFFNVIESLAPANGFENYYQEKDGQRVAMGGAAQNRGGALIFKLPFAFRTDIVIKKDGAVFKTITANTRRELAIPIEQNGVYRSEISLSSGRFRKLPWIMTNPFFVAVPGVAAPAAATVARPLLTMDESLFLAEKNGGSSAAVRHGSNDGQGTITSLAFTLQPEADGNPNFWVALAFRQKLAAAGYRGFVFETRAGAPLRVWLQFRSSSGRYRAHYQHSFLAGPEWRRVTIPFSAFYQILGKTSVSRSDSIDSFFFLVDGGNAYPGASGEIFFRQVGLY